MRITRDYGLTSSKLEHDLLASIDKSMRDDIRKRRKKASAPKPERKYSHKWNGRSLGGISYGQKKTDEAGGSRQRAGTGIWEGGVREH